MKENERRPVTPRSLVKMKKKGERIAMLTAYDFPTAEVLDEAGIDAILVGDSLGMVVLGHETTLPVTMEDVIRHAAAVARARPKALVIGDLPFLSYTVSVPDAVANAGRLVKEAGVGAVKLEGGRAMIPVIRAILRASIPVMGHIGLTPQSILRFGGYVVQGRSAIAQERLVEAAKGLEDAGCFAIVLEAIPPELAARVTEAVGIPTIGIGAGPHCDGQILVTHDLLGIYDKKLPRFVKRYAELRAEMLRAFRAYAGDVRKGAYPGPEHVYDGGGSDE
ncbi:MAG: 3-methyl-2-oxobutanoate hydroxymethyltransferase [Candidatus Latescibacterota bacterium]|nr:MAG: 3-methyl-2-oxobutanoate hydroxymethyltransferase [Candidatus Latescibacterota bacterium]